MSSAVCQRPVAEHKLQEYVFPLGVVATQNLGVARNVVFPPDRHADTNAFL